MNRKIAAKRRSPSAVIWLLFGAFTIAVLASVALGLLAWEEAKQLQVLEAELEILRGERTATDAQLVAAVALQATASAMENRLATLEAHDTAQQLAVLQATVEAAGSAADSESAQLTDVRASLAEVQAEVSGFQGTLDDLAARCNALPQCVAPVETLPSKARLTVARQRQSHNLSCESSAASMVAQYHGVNLSEAEVLDQLPLNDNPHLGFRGNVDGPTGGIQDYGVYADPILHILNSRGLRAWLVEGGLDGIKSAIARGNPVIAWVTYDGQPSTPTTANINGEKVTLVPWQHVVVVTGYNAQGVWANDPWDGQEDFYPAADMKRAMGYFGDMAIEVAGP